MSTSQRVLDSIRRVVRLLREGSRASEDAVGLSAAQLFVLQMLDPERPLSLKDVAARTLTHQSSVSVVVSRLVERGLVLRRPASDDARRLELLPTKKGLALRARAPEAAQQRVIAAVEALSAREQRALADGLDALVGALDLDQVAPTLFDEEPHRKSRGKKRRAS